MLSSLLGHRLFRPLVIMNFRGLSLVAKFALTLFIAHFMSFEILGLYGLIAGMSLIVPTVISLSIMYYYSRDAVTQSEFQITQNLKHYTRFISALYLPLAAITLAYGYYSDQIILYALIVVLLFLEHLGNDIYSLMLNLSRPFSANFLFFIRTGLWIFIYIVAAYFMPALRTLESVLIGWIVGDVVALAGFFYTTRHWPWRTATLPQPVFQWAFGIFKKAKTLYGFNLVFTAAQYLDRYLITFFLGLELTGVYVLFWSLCSALSNLTRTGVVQIARPALVKGFHESKEIFHALVHKCLRDTGVVTILMALCAVGGLYFILPYLDKPLLTEWFMIFPIMILSFVVGMIGEVWGLVFYSQHRDDLTLKSYFAVLAVSLLANLSLLPTIGLWGAGAAFLLTNLIGMIIQQIYAKKLL